MAALVQGPAAPQVAQAIAIPNLLLLCRRSVEEMECFGHNVRRAQIDQELAQLGVDTRIGAGKRFVQFGQDYLRRVAAQAAEADIGKLNGAKLRQFLVWIELFQRETSEAFQKRPLGVGTGVAGEGERGGQGGVDVGFG